ncbi:MAG TPA: hypothetical protein VJB12_06385 [Candidatus Nanoarchaeia archaeon]|nr:hypothetical protein [Candidatus Nanoarchaeia archaeon]
MPKTIAKDTPLCEITLRRYEKPGKLSEREMVRKICLSLGLLQPGDSRDAIVDILHVLIKARRERQGLSSEDIENAVIENRKKHHLAQSGIASSNILRQIRRLKDLLLIEKAADKYRISEFEDLSVLFEQKIEGFYLKSITQRVKEYLMSIR